MYSLKCIYPVQTSSSFYCFIIQMFLEHLYLDVKQAYLLNIAKKSSELSLKLILPAVFLTSVMAIYSSSYQAKALEGAFDFSISLSFCHQSTSRP